MGKVDNEIVKLIKVVYRMEGTMISKFDETKGDLKEVKDHLVKLNNSVYKNTSFRNKLNGGLKIIGILIGSGALIFIVKFLYNLIR